MNVVSSKFPALNRSFCSSKLAISSPLINITRAPASSGFHSVCSVSTFIVTVCSLLQIATPRHVKFAD